MIFPIRIGGKEWDQDFRYMQSIGIDTVIMIRSGYRKFITYPSGAFAGQRVLYAFRRFVGHVPSAGGEISHEVLFWFI